jgi:hypothetical protein
MQPSNAHGWIIRGETGKRFTDGFEVLEVSGTKPATITSVRSIGGSTALKFLGAKIAGPGRKLTYERLQGWPPTKAALGPLSDAVGARLLPRKQTRLEMGYELLVGYELEDASKLVMRTRLEVNYTVAGKDYVYRIPGSLIVCPKGTTDDACLDAASS